MNVKLKGAGGIPTAYTADGTDYIVHTFLSSGVFVASFGFDVDYLVVAGGGGGGSNEGSGGGAGGFRSATGLSVTAQSYAVTVGAGGAGGLKASNQGNDGNDSIFSSITSTAGGGGGAHVPNNNGRPGGSGGGATRT